MKNKSTSTALHCLTENWLNNINSRKINGVCQIDKSLYTAASKPNLQNTYYIYFRSLQCLNF